MTILGVILMLAVAPPQTGRLQLTFTERSPLSAPEVAANRWQRDQRRWRGPPDKFQVRNWDYDLAQESFEVAVPADYKREIPCGLLVWVGVTEFSPEWFDVLARRKLIYIAAQKKGNRTYVPGALHVDGVHNIKKLYNINEKRVYACGFSDGGRGAMGMVVGYPEVFHGAFCLMGDDFYLTYKDELTVEGSAWRGPLAEIKKDMRLVLMRGQRDTFTPAQGRLQYEGLLLDGFERVSFFVLPNKGHEHPNAAWFGKGIEALDNAKPTKPPTTSPTTQPRPSAGQIAQAKRLLATARFWKESSWPGDPGPREARKYLQQILDEYPTTPAAKTARQMLEAAYQATTKPKSK